MNIARANLERTFFRSRELNPMRVVKLGLGRCRGEKLLKNDQEMKIGPCSIRSFFARIGGRERIKFKSFIFPLTCNLNFFKQILTR